MSSDHSQEILACLSAHDFDLLLLSASTGFRFTSAPSWHDHCAMRGKVTLSGFPPGGAEPLKIAWRMSMTIAPPVATAMPSFGSSPRRRLSEKEGRRRLLYS